MSTEHDPPEPLVSRIADESSRGSDDGERRRDDEATALARPEADTASSSSGASAPAEGHHAESPNMLPGREVRRSGFERLLVRLIATCGVIGIGVAIAAILVSNKTQGWVVGLVVSIVTVALSAILWSSRQL